MKKTIVISFLICFSFLSCFKKLDLNNIWGVSTNKDIYFTLTINGKTLTSYGVKFANSTYQDLLFDFLVATTSTFTDFNNSIVTETTLMVDPLYDEFWNWGQFGLRDGEVSANIDIRRNGTILGIHQVDNSFFNTLTDKTNGNIEYEIIPTGSTVNITEANQQIIKGTMNLRLKLGNQTIPANGTFRLFKGF
jgi:hypothetical protein